jgi:hypothetical protein
VAVVEEAIKYCGCHHRIAKHCAPLADAAIAGEQDRALLITAADELEEQVRRVGLEWQITKFINNQELRFAELRKPFFVASGKAQERRMRTKSETFLRDPEGSTPSR